MFTAILTLTFVTSAIVCHYIAKSNGKRPVFWGVMGAVFGPLAIPFVLLNSKRSESDNN